MFRFGIGDHVQVQVNGGRTVSGEILGRVDLGDGHAYYVRKLSISPVDALMAVLSGEEPRVRASLFPECEISIDARDIDPLEEITIAMFVTEEAAAECMDYMHERCNALRLTADRRGICIRDAHKIEPHTYAGVANIIVDMARLELIEAELFAGKNSVNSGNPGTSFNVSVDPMRPKPYTVVAYWDGREVINEFVTHDERGTVIPGLREQWDNMVGSVAEKDLATAK